MRTHQVVNVVLRPLILASTMTGFSLSGFSEDANLGKMEYESRCAACTGVAALAALGAVIVSATNRPIHRAWCYRQWLTAA
jgi:hypothetical protein